MVKTFNMTLGRRAFNRFLGLGIKLGLAPSGYYLLATLGRQSGRIHVMPIYLIQEDDQRWLVSPYGVRDWVLNVRANPRIQLERGGKREDLEAYPAGTAEAAKILKRYVNDVSIVRPYVEVEPSAPVEEFEQIADRHPVFRVVEPELGGSSSS